MLNKKKTKTFNSIQLVKWLSWMVSFAAVIVVAVFAIYFFEFHGELSTKNSDWGTFGDFIGGSLNPILSFFALIALLLTIVLQSRELEATREELKRAADAHENSERAMAISNYSSIVMSLADAQSILGELSKDAHNDRKNLQKYITVLNHVRQLEYILAEQRNNLKLNGFEKIENQNKGYFEVFGPLINLLPLDLEKYVNEDFEDEDPDFHFFLSSFVKAASKTDLKQNHNTWIWVHHIEQLVNDTAETKIVTFEERKKLNVYFGKLFEWWHLECFEDSPHAFKRNQIKNIDS